MWAAAAEGYVFSEEPQDKFEQWLHDNYAELWNDGVRQVSVRTETAPFIKDQGEATPSALVQYVDGVRYDGTESLPLGFRGQDPTAMPTDAAANVLASIKDTLAGGKGGMVTKDNFGAGGYKVFVDEDPKTEGPRGREEFDTSVTWSRSDYSGSPTVGSRLFESADEAIAWLLEGDNLLEVPGSDRKLFPGELAVLEVGVANDARGNGYRRGVLDPSSREFVWLMP